MQLIQLSLSHDHRTIGLFPVLSMLRGSLWVGLLDNLSEKPLFLTALVFSHGLRMRRADVPQTTQAGGRM